MGRRPSQDQRDDVSSSIIIPEAQEVVTSDATAAQVVHHHQHHHGEEGLDRPLLLAIPQASNTETSTKTTYHHHHRPTTTMISDEYANIPEAKGLMWQDDFFDDAEDDDIVAVFDFDYESMETFYTNVNWCTLACTLLYTPVFVASMVGLAPCFLRRNVEWNVRSKHVAITRDGIRFVQDRRKCCWGLACTDQGKCSKTVPFDKITDCDIHEPAGNTCCVVPNILTTVKIDTASSSQPQTHELVLAGLKDAERFKKLVWAMKRRKCAGPASMLSSMEMIGRGDPTTIANTSNGNSSDDGNVSSLLREIRDELRQNNNLLATLRADQNTTTTTSNVEPSAPNEEEEEEVHLLLPTLT